MESVYGALILHSAGKKITEAAIEKILTAAGVKDVDKNQLKALVAGIKGKNLDDIISSAAAAPVAVSAAPAAEAKEEKPDKKKKEKKKKEEKKEEEEPTGIGALFG